MMQKRILFFITGRWYISATLVSPNISVRETKDTETGGKATDPATFLLNESDGSAVFDAFSRSAPERPRKTEDTVNMMGVVPI